MNKLPVRLNRLFFIVVMAFAVISSSVLNSDLTFAEPGEIVEEPIEPGEITDPELPTIPPEEITDPEPPTTPPGEIIDPGQPPTTGGSGGDSNTPNPIKPPTPEITTPVNRPQKTVMETRLSMLTMNCGNLVPEFSPDIYEYTVYVTKDQENKNCGTSAESVDQTADISAEGPLEFTDEDVVKTITVTATNGEQAQYTITVHIIRDTELLINNKVYTISGKLSLELLPEGFVQDSELFKGVKVSCAKSKDGAITLIQYIAASNIEDILWYRLDTNNDKVYPVEVVDINGKKCIVISDDKEFIYGYNGETQQYGYYIYDSDTKTVEFLVPHTNAVGKDARKTRGNKILLVALSACILLLGMTIFVIHKKFAKQQKITPEESKYFRPYISLIEDKNSVKKEEK